MANVSVARRYARALTQLAQETSGLETVQAQLDLLVQAIDSIAELKDVVTNPAYTKAQRITVLETVIRAVKDFDPMLENFIRLLVDRDRIAELPDISRSFRDMADAIAGRIRGRITSAIPLPDETVRAVKRSLDRITDRQVMLEATVQPSLLGGVTAQVGSTVYDGSLKNHLEQLRKELKER